MYGRRYLYCRGTPELLFTENETNARRLFPKGLNGTPFVKDGINDCVVNGARAAVNPAETGTKCAARYGTTIPGGGRLVVELRMTDTPLADPFDGGFDETFRQRIEEADAFYAGVIPKRLSDDATNVMRSPPIVALVACAPRPTTR